MRKMLGTLSISCLSVWPSRVKRLTPGLHRRLATHILAFEDDGKVVWFEGGYSEYAEDLRKRTGNADTSRIKYRKMATV